MLKKTIIEKIIEMKPFYEPNCVHNIFSWKELEQLINLRPILSNKRFRLNNSKNYTWPYQAWLSDVNTFPPEVVDKELKKYSGYITDMSRSNKNINALCDQLEKNVGMPTDAHIYFSLLENDIEKSGFPIHWDTSHNLIVQVEGVSQHYIWNKKATDNDLRNIDSLSSLPDIDVIMKPGDVTFIPMKTYHKVIPKSKRISISFPMTYNNGYNFQDRKWISIVES